MAWWACSNGVIPMKPSSLQLSSSSSFSSSPSSSLFSLLSSGTFWRDGKNRHVRNEGLWWPDSHGAARYCLWDKWSAMDIGGRVAFIYISHVITDHSWPMTQQWEDHHYCAALSVFSKQKQPILWFFFFFYRSQQGEWKPPDLSSNHFCLWGGWRSYKAGAAGWWQAAWTGWGVNQYWLQPWLVPLLLTAWVS